MYYTVKIIVTATLVIIIAELAKRSSFAGAFLASIPLVSVLALVWLYIDTKDVSKVSDLATSVFWLVLPSLALFISLPIFIKNNLGFYLSVSLSIIITAVCYWLMIYLLNYLGIKL